jgi:hypothetical protein
LSGFPNELIADLAGLVVKLLLRGRIDAVSLPAGDTPRSAARKLRTERLTVGASVVPGRRSPKDD